MSDLAQQNVKKYPAQGEIQLFRLARAIESNCSALRLPPSPHPEQVEADRLLRQAPVKRAPNWRSDMRQRGGRDKEHPQCGFDAA